MDKFKEKFRMFECEINSDQIKSVHGRKVELLVKYENKDHQVTLHVKRFANKTTKINTLGHFSQDINTLTKITCMNLLSPECVVSIHGSSSC